MIPFKRTGGSSGAGMHHKQGSTKVTLERGVEEEHMIDFYFNIQDYVSYLILQQYINEITRYGHTVRIVVGIRFTHI